MKKMYLENIVNLLEGLADKIYQINVWLNTNNPENLSDSFSESVSLLFDGEGVDDFLKDKEIILSKDVTKVLQELSDVVDKVGYDKTESEIIDSPEMEAVRQKAAKALELIKASDGSESTVNFVKVGTTDTPISIQDAFK